MILAGGQIFETKINFIILIGTMKYQTAIVKESFRENGKNFIKGDKIDLEIPEGNLQPNSLIYMRDGVISYENLEFEGRKIYLKPSYKQSSFGVRCSYCGQIFKNTFELDSHIVINHLEEFESNFSNKKIIRKPPPFDSFEPNLIPPPKEILTENKLGYWRGIQGENNSCYLDCCLFAMFAFTSTFDEYLFVKKDDLNDPKCQKNNMIVERLRTDIVNDLRQSFFVYKHNVIQWRRMLLDEFGKNDFNGICSERDIEEFVSYLFPILKVNPLKLTSKETTYYLQLLISSQMIGKVLTTQEIMNWTLQSELVKLSEKSNYLILIVPRYSNKEKSYKAIIPSRKLIMTENFLSFPEPFELQYDLFSVCCIGLSHYVTYSVLCEKWYFFDSMADRINEESII
jgi:hypothetical protein